VSTLLLQATSLLTALGMAGTPAVLAACLALCVPGMAHAAAGASETGHQAHAGHATTVAVAHQDHQTPDPHAGHHDATGDADQSGADQSCCADAGWQGLPGACCPDATVTPGRTVPAARDAAVLSPHGVAVTVARVFAPPSSPASFSPLSRPLVPPSPTRSPLVLRI